MKVDDMEVVWAEMAYQEEQFMLNPSLRTLIMRIFTGGGKTTKTLKEMDENCRWIYCAPFHKNIKENITDSHFRTYDFLHLKSRSKLCINPDAKILFKMNYEKGLTALFVRVIFIH